MIAFRIFLDIKSTGPAVARRNDGKIGIRNAPKVDG